MFLNKKNFKIVLLVGVFFASCIFCPCVTYAAEIDVQEIYIDFSEVEIGSRGTSVLHIENNTRNEITFTLSFGTCSCGGTPFSVATPTVAVAGFTTASVEVYFTPSSLETCWTSLFVFYGENNLADIEVTGTGIEATTTQTDPAEDLDLLQFFNKAVEDEKIVGSGPGNSAENRLNALRNMIRVVVDLLENEEFIEACEKLQAIYKKIDGQPKPQDFVKNVEGTTGLSDLQDKVLEVIESNGCN